MGKTLGKIAAGIAIIGLAVVTGGVSIIPSVTVAGGAAAATLATTALGGALLSLGVGTILSGVLEAIAPMRSATSNALQRLNLSFNPDAPRKIWFGNTAGATDVLYQEASGDDQEYIDMIVVTSAHGIQGFDSIYFEDKLAWTSGGGAQGIYSGYLTATAVPVGVSGAGTVINGGAKWGANASLTGCSYVKLRIKRTGNTSKADSPLVSGFSSRMTIIGRGAKVYDPRRDTTAGGIGAQRADDETTWQYEVSGEFPGRNPALQALAFMIGYRIGGVLSVGMGVPLARINMADFIAAANVCDEDVALAGGGTQKRYEAAGIFNDSDNPSDVLSALCTSMNAKMRDTGGRIGIRMLINDTAGTLLTFDETDIMGQHKWTPADPLDSSFNVVRGSFTDPSAVALYQQTPYAARSVASPDGISRELPLDLPLLQDGTRAQRVAEQALQRGQIRGKFMADFGPRAWACEEGQPVRLTFSATGFTSKLFRVERQTLKIINSDEDTFAFCPMVLVEESADIYAWNPDGAGPQPAAVSAVSYLPTNQPFILTQGQDINVENGAVTGDNLQINSRIETDLTGYNPAGFTLSRTEGTNNPPQKWVLSTVEAANANEFQFPRVPVVGGRRVFFSVRVLRTAALTGLFFNANEFNAATGGGIGPVGGAQSVVPTTAGVWQQFTWEGTTLSESGFIQTSIRLLDGNAGRVEVAGFTISYSQPGADVTSEAAALLSVPANQTIQADSGGTPISGQVPRSLAAVRTLGGTNVSASTTWSLSVAAGVATISSSGVISLISQPPSGSITVTSVRDGVTLTGTFLVATNSATPTPPSGGGTSASWTSYTTTASSSFVEVAVEKTVTTGGVGTLTASAPLGFSAVLGDFEFAGAEAKWQYRTPAGSGSWVDFGSAVSESVEAYGGNFGGGEPEPAYSGTIAINQTTTGPAASTSYGVRLLARSPDSKTITLFGTSTVEGT